MKNFLRRAALSTALFASFLPLGIIPAYAAEPQPAVTINGDPADIRAKYINGKFYFSVVDFWTEVAYDAPSDIKLDTDNQLVSNGSLVISVKDRNWYRHSYITTKFTEPIYLEDDTVWVAVSALRDMSYRTIVSEIKDDVLNFKQIYWENSDGKPYPYWFHLIPLDKETGLPLFSTLEQVRKHSDFDESHFHILSQELENGKTIFAYVNKIDPQKFALVTCVDGYVSHVQDHNGIFDSSFYATRSE